MYLLLSSTNFGTTFRKDMTGTLCSTRTVTGREDYISEIAGDIVKNGWMCQLAASMILIEVSAFVLRILSNTTLAVVKRSFVKTTIGT